MRRTRFQQGSLQIVKRAGGRKAWEYRWYELQADGSRTRRNLMVGSLEQYPNETAAQKAVAALRADINAENPRTSLTPISVQTLVEHYREKELGPDCTKTRETQVTYVGYFRKWILPRWGSYHVTEVKAVAVEQWLRSLKYANGSKAKARNIMSAVFNHAVSREWLDVNPIRMVRQSAKRTRMPIVLSIEQIAALLRILKEPTRTMVFLAVFTGLRVGELFFGFRSTTRLSVDQDSVSFEHRVAKVGGNLIVRMEIEFPCFSTFQIGRRQTGRIALAVVHLFDTPAEVSGSSAETIFAGSCACRAVFPESLRILPATP